MPDQRTLLTERFLEITGPLVVVNLPYRHDRRAEFAAQLNRIGLSYEHPKVRIFDAIRPETTDGFPTIGTRGCFLSHLGILRQAVSDGLDRLLICEDDLDFAPQFADRLPAIIAALQSAEWSIFYGGYGDQPAGSEVAGGLARIDPNQEISCTHFYAIRGPAIADLVNYLDAMLARPAGHPDGGPMHYDGALCWFRKSHPRHVTLAALPAIGVQRPSRTDIHALKWFDRVPGVRMLATLARRAGAARQKASQR